MPTTYQTGQNVIVAYKVQAAKGSPESGGSGEQLRLRASQGLKLTKALIESGEIRADGQTTRGRHGTRSASAQYETELSVGTLDTIFQAVLRGTWVAAASITQAAMTSITTGTNTIVAAAGSWLTQGVRVGDMVKLTDHSVVANNGKWLRVLGVTASTITLPASSLTAEAGADASFTLTVAKTLIQANPPTERYFTVDEHEQDVDVAYTGTDMKWHSMNISMAPDQPITVQLGLTGLDINSVSAGSAPVLTSPTITSTLPLVMSDGIVRIGSTDYTDLTAFSLNFDVPANAPAVLAPNAVDVFLSNAKLSGSFSALRSGSTFWSAFDNETQMEFFILCKENETEPTDFVSFYVGNAVLDGADAPRGSVGAMVETVPWRAGKDTDGGEAAATTLKISTSAA